MSTDARVAPLGARNATLSDLAGLLRDQQARKADVVAPAAAIRAEGARLVVAGTDPVLGPDGVTMTTGTYTPTEVCDQGVADKLGIPAAYLRRLREHKPGLYDANVNAWLDGDDRKFLLRCLRPASGEGPGVVRAFLSDGYKIIDNLDVLLAGYRSPFTGASGADNPVVFAGFVITNSETGCGAKPHNSSPSNSSLCPTRCDRAWPPRPPGPCSPRSDPVGLFGLRRRW
jgi:hypothetical protein